MAKKFNDYYEVLQVPRTASEEEIKLAYRRRAREHHPDLHPDKDKDLHTHRMREVNEAYAVLSNKENRAKYDQLGEHWKEGPPPQDNPPPRENPAGRFSEEGAGAFSDFFQNMFRQSEGGGEAENVFPSDLDIEAVLDLSLEEAVKGAEKSLSLMTRGLCQSCHGTGRRKGAFCPVCGGVGETRQQREIKTRIPPGVLEGGRIRLKGEGSQGPRGRGDLYLRIHLLPDSRFRIDGINLETEARIMPWQAALGSEVMVQTLEGPLRVRIPKGTHSEKQLRLAGKGLGKPGSRGDLFIRVVIDIPSSLSPKAEALFKQLEEETHERIF